MSDYALLLEILSGPGPVYVVPRRIYERSSVIPPGYFEKECEKYFGDPARWPCPPKNDTTDADQKAENLEPETSDA